MFFELHLAINSSSVVMQQLETRDKNKILMVILVIPKLLRDLSETVLKLDREREIERCAAQIWETCRLEGHH